MTTWICSSFISREGQGRREIFTLFVIFVFEIALLSRKNLLDLLSLCYLYPCCVRSSWAFIMLLEGWQLKKGRTFDLCAQNRLGSSTSCFKLVMFPRYDFKVLFQNVVSDQAWEALHIDPLFQESLESFPDFFMRLWFLSSVTWHKLMKYVALIRRVLLILLYMFSFLRCWIQVGVVST